MASRPLTPRMAALVERLKSGKLLVANVAPDTGWCIASPYSEEDGRTCQALLARGLLQSKGGGVYVLVSPAPSTTTPYEQER